ncbi:MAG: hypothetical protein GY848_03155 [Methyloversatilis sp.]|jgi:hypothetical protein|nr:hypothetical protein [Methyloversatilis sp.]
MPLIIPQQFDGNPRQYWDAAWFTGSLQADVAHFAGKPKPGAEIAEIRPTITNRYANSNPGLQRPDMLISPPEHSGRWRTRS